MDREHRAYHAFLRRVCRWGGLAEWEAEEAAATILCAFETRVADGGTRSLQAVLAACPRHEHAAPRELDRASLVRLVAQELGVARDAADDVVHAVFAAARSVVDAAEAQVIAERLPADLQPLWRTPAGGER